MSNILMAWELGSHYGHLMRLSTIGGQLRAAGHRLLFAVRDLRSGSEILGARGFDLVQAPVFHRRQRPGLAPASHAEMLAIEGYSDETATSGRVRGWMGLAELFGAEAIVADHAPGALLADRILGLPVAQIGTGFEIPPQGSPMPSIRPWENISRERLLRSDQRVTDTMNGVVGNLGGAPLESLSDLFATDARVLATFPELDPFGPRPEERYVGPIVEGGFGEPMEWGGGEAARIFAYLRQNVGGAEHLLRALKGVEAKTICVFPDIAAGLLEEVSSDRLRITRRPVRLDSILAKADLALLYGGHGMICAALAAGVPLLLVPQNVEQYLHATRLQDAGLARMLREVATESAAAESIEGALHDTALRSSAREFASRHAGFESSRAVEQAVEMIGGMIRERAAG